MAKKNVPCFLNRVSSSWMKYFWSQTIGIWSTTYSLTSRLTKPVKQSPITSCTIVIRSDSFFTIWNNFWKDSIQPAWKKCFNFLRKFRFVYHLIETHLYSESYSVPLADYFENNKPIKPLTVKQCEPLRLAKLAKLKIKTSLKYLDISLVNQLDLPKDLRDYLSAGLVTGLERSFERNKMNKLFSVDTESNQLFYSLSPLDLFVWQKFFQKYLLISFFFCPIQFNSIFRDLIFCYLKVCKNV